MGEPRGRKFGSKYMTCKWCGKRIVAMPGAGKMCPACGTYHTPSQVKKAIKDMAK